METIASNKSDRLYKKADKHVWTSERAQAKGDQQKFEKYQGKAWKNLYESAQYKKAAEKHLENSIAINKRITDISNETLKAGKDYVVNKNYSIGVDIPLGTVLTRTQRIDYR